MNYQPSILARLRAICPKRGMSRDEARQVAERQAVTLLRLTGATDAPVPLQILADLPRIELAVESGLPSSGCSFWTGSAWRLVASASEHPNRQRFSLMHEFKHVIDHPVRDLLYGSEADRERLADHFAGCVLMPRIAVTRAWCSGMQNLDDLARHFAVSPEAMRVRLGILGLGTPVRSRTYSCRRGLRETPQFAIAGRETAQIAAGGPR